MSRVIEPVSSSLVHGHGTVELFDERGKLVERVPFENFIALAMLERSRWQVRQDFAPSSALIGANYVDPTPGYPLTHINLGTSTAAESPSTERRLLGDTVGWSNKSAYAGADTRRGSPNLAESTAGPATIKYVFDWPTHAGNGTFQSVAWVLGSDSHGIQQASWDWSGAGFDSYPRQGGAYDPTGDTFLFKGYASTYRIHRVTRAQTSLTAPSNNDNHRLIAVNAGLLWQYRVDTNDFYGATLGSSTVTDTRVGYKANVPNGLADATINAAGTEFWCVNGSSGAVVHRLSFTDGTYLGTYAVPFVPYLIGTLGDDILISSTHSNNQTKWARVATDGTVKWVVQTPGHVYSSNSIVHMAGVDISGEEWVAGGISSSTQGWHIARLDNKSMLGTRTLLPTPVTKLNTQTLKVSYQFDFS